jgi:hypothetical protein
VEKHAAPSGLGPREASIVAAELARSSLTVITGGVFAAAGRFR